MVATSAKADELRALRAFQGAESFESYVRRTSPVYWPVPPHLRRIYDLVDRSRREQVFATISVPPRHGKTTTLELGTAYRVTYDPACLNFYVTFGDDRALGFGRSVRKRVLAEGVPLDRAAGSVDDWRTAAGGGRGGLRATSKRGPITGEGANGGLVTIDDILKGFSEARSKMERDYAHSYMKTDVMSRIEGGASVILINTRWHEDDVIGRLMRDGWGLPWEHINLPAVHDGNFNPIDERLYPERAVPLWDSVDDAHPNDPAAAMRWYALCRARGEAEWWALYQGVPRSDTAKVFAIEPARYSLPIDVRGMRGCLALDPAATAKTSADYSSLGVGFMEGYGTKARLYVRRRVKRQITVPEVARLALSWQRQWRLPLVVESVGAFKAIPQMLRELAPGIRLFEIQPLGDKLTRAQPAASAWNDGRIMVPAGVDVSGAVVSAADVDWVDEFVGVVRAFTGAGDAEDDDVDMLSMLWNTLYREQPSQQRGAYRASY